jgi:hypothetical protein
LKTQVKKISILHKRLLLSLSISFAMATIDLAYVQFWQLPLNPFPPKQRITSPHVCKNGKSGSTTSSRNQPTSLENKADEVLRRDNPLKLAVAATQH